MLGISTVENIDHDQNMNDIRFGVYRDDFYNTLQTLVTKDVATEDIQILLINVETNDTNKMKQFVQDRLIGNKFHEALQQSKLKHFMICTTLQ